MELSTLELTPEEKMVFDFIKEHGKVTQLDIVRGCPKLGSHPRHEGYDNTDSTARKIRQIIRNMVMNHKLQIMSDDNGYYLKSENPEIAKEQINEYMSRFERQAKASAKSYMEKYHVMRKTYGWNSDYFNKQIDLFDT